MELVADLNNDGNFSDSFEFLVKLWLWFSKIKILLDFLVLEAAEEMQTQRCCLMLCEVFSDTLPGFWCFLDFLIYFDVCEVLPRCFNKSFNKRLTVKMVQETPTCPSTCIGMFWLSWRSTLLRLLNVLLAPHWLLDLGK